MLVAVIEVAVEAAVEINTILTPKRTIYLTLESISIIEVPGKIKANTKVLVKITQTMSICIVNRLISQTLDSHHR